MWIVTVASNSGLIYKIVGRTISEALKKAGIVGGYGRVLDKYVKR